MKFTLELSEGQAKDFLAWVAGWYEYDPLNLDDNDFRNACEVYWQISEQLKGEK